MLGAAVVTVGTLQEVQEHDVDWAAALDAFAAPRRRTHQFIESIAMQLEGSGLFVDNLVRSLAPARRRSPPAAN